MGHQVLTSGWDESLVTAPGEPPCAALPGQMTVHRLRWVGAWQARGRGRLRPGLPQGPQPGVHLPPVALGMCVCPQEELQHRQVSGCQLAGLPCLSVQGPGAL